MFKIAVGVQNMSIVDIKELNIKIECIHIMFFDI